MNKEEIEKAKEILKQPITVNCVNYKYFTQENYDKLISVCDNALWLLNIYEQVLNEHLDLKDRIVKAVEYIEENERKGTLWLVKTTDELKDLLKGDKE